MLDDGNNRKARYDASLTRRGGELMEVGTIFDRNIKSLIQCRTNARGKGLRLG